MKPKGGKGHAGASRRQREVELLRNVKMGLKPTPSTNGVEGVAQTSRLNPEMRPFRSERGL